jgi:hypothetical protein
MTNLNVLQFVENGVTRQVKSGIQKLKKEGLNEVLYTTCGERILLDSLISMNGVTWA